MKWILLILGGIAIVILFGMMFDSLGEMLISKFGIKEALLFRVRSVLMICVGFCYGLLWMRWK